MFATVSQRLTSRFSSGESGQTMMLFAFLFVALAGFVALSLDIGGAVSSRSQAQRAVDAAALAAAKVLLDGGSAAAAEEAAEAWIENNDYTDATTDSEVEVHVPPASGPHAGDSQYAEVVVVNDTEADFAKVVGKETITISARAVAGINLIPKPYSIIVLNRTACQALQVIGNSTIKIVGSGIMDNSECESGNEAFYVQGSSLITDEVNDVAGGHKYVGNVSVTPPVTPAIPIADPLAGVAAPTPPSGPARTCPTLGSGGGSYTFEPGVYDCALSPGGGWTLTFLPGNYLITGGIVFNNNITATFGAGIYTLRGEGLKVLGNANVTATGAMFYIDNGACLETTGDGTMRFTAPSSGTYRGIVFFQSRDNSCTAKLSGNSANTGWGTVYIPKGMIDFAGNTNTNFQFISDTLYMHGNGTINITWDDNFAAERPFVHIAE
jgi:Flp pilus assembly protein TadG